MTLQAPLPAETLQYLSRLTSIPTFVPAARGQKRESDGDDGDRDGDREEVYEDDAIGMDQSSTAVQPAQSSSASASMSVDQMCVSHRHVPPCRRAEARAIESLEAEGRLQGMAVVREKLGCRNDLSEVYSPPELLRWRRQQDCEEGSSWI